MITDYVFIKQGTPDYIEFEVQAFFPDSKELLVLIESIGDRRWEAYTPFKPGHAYFFKRHWNSNNEPFDGPDPMELWEYMRPGQKENETILPQVLLYYWHKDKKLDMELDW